MYNARKLYPLAITVVFMVAACIDYDPVAIDATSPELAEQDLPASAANATGGQQIGDEIAESFRHRLAVDLSFDGDLIPNETITLTLEGVANETLTGGDVRVMLPTKSAMDHAGAGKVPHFPAGRQIPAVASWILPRMDAGATWEQSLEISLPESGYYQVAVMVTALAPDERANPVVIDAFDIERWLLVMDGGGLVTFYLDESRLPEGVLTGEGPFRQKARPTSADMTGGANADSDDEISFEVVYYEGGTRKHAEGAEMHIDYLDQLDESVRSFEVTVPSDGIVTVDCPDPYEYIVSRVLVTNTSETIGQYLIGGSEVYNSDCGTTRTVVSNAYYFIVWRNLNEVIPIIEDYFDEDRTAIRWEMVFVDSGGTYYYPNSDKVTYDYLYYGSKWTVAHEFSHGLHHKGLGGITGTGSCAGHEIGEPSSYSCAFSEGFADFAASVGIGNPGTWERNGYSEAGYDDAEIEGNVARLLWDLIDDNEDGNDETSYPPDFIADVFETCRASGVKRNDVSDFVWCLENRVNSTVHNDAFPRGPGAPSYVSRTATDPGDYDADEIRATWEQNVG